MSVPGLRRVGRVLLRVGVADFVMAPVAVGVAILAYDPSLVGAAALGFAQDFSFPLLIQALALVLLAIPVVAGLATALAGRELSGAMLERAIGPVLILQCGLGAAAAWVGVALALARPPGGFAAWLLLAAGLAAALLVCARTLATAIMGRVSQRPWTQLFYEPGVVARPALLAGAAVALAAVLAAKATSAPGLLAAADAWALGGMVAALGHRPRPTTFTPA